MRTDDGGNWGQTPITLYPQHARQAGALAAAQSVVTSAIAEQAMAMGITGQKVGDLIHAARVAAVAAWGGWPTGRDCMTALTTAIGSGPIANGDWQPPGKNVKPLTG
jgi:hypothetical protein